MRILATIIVCAALVAALTAGPAGAARTASVSLKDIKFKPATVAIKKGDRVRWTWKDGATPHNVVSRGSKRFKSSSLKTDGQHVVRFRKTGTYRYVCTIHLGMDGKVVVR